MKSPRISVGFVPLVLGIILLWSGYFVMRAIELSEKETADAEIRTLTKEYFHLTVQRKYSPYASDKGHEVGEYLRPEVHFFHKSTGRWYTVRPRCLGFFDCKAGERTKVIFPEGEPLAAEIYSLGDFWFRANSIGALLGISVLGSFIYVIIMAKPWKS